MGLMNSLLLFHQKDQQCVALGWTGHRILLGHPEREAFEIGLRHEGNH